MTVLALLLLMAHREASSSAVSLPKAVVEAFVEASYRIPAAVPTPQVAHGDFDANGHEDWAVLINPDSPKAMLLLAYRFPDHWRVGNVDVWQATPRPLKVEVLSPGSYARDSRCPVPPQPNESERIESAVAGILVTFADGRKHAYQLGLHAWRYVCFAAAP
jgi:hypothetical protein